MIIDNISLIRSLLVFPKADVQDGKVLDEKFAAQTIYHSQS